MPNFPPIDPALSQESALNMILHSIALEETALSHVINAEGEKVQAVVTAMERNCHCHGSDISELLEVNKSVYDVLEQVKDIQMLLKSKMTRTLEHLPKPPAPCSPLPPPKPECNKCCCICRPTSCSCAPENSARSIFKIFRADFTHDAVLSLSRVNFCDGDLKLNRNYSAESELSLSNNKYVIEFIVELEKEYDVQRVCLEFKINEAKSDVKTIEFASEDDNLCGGLIHDFDKALLSLRIHSPEKVRVKGGIVIISKG